MITYIVKNYTLMSITVETDWNDIVEDPEDPNWEEKDSKAVKIVKAVKAVKADKADKIDKAEKIVKADKADKADKIVKSDRPPRPDKSDKSDKSDIDDSSVAKITKKPLFKSSTFKPVKPDKSDDKPDNKSDDNTEDKKKYYPHVPCWYLVHNFQCMQSECWFNHNPTIIKEHKLKRENKVCHLYRKCDKRCNKFHNMDELMELYTSVNSKLSAIESIIKT
jgi:hypothetical protein